MGWKGRLAPKFTRIDNLLSLKLHSNTKKLCELSVQNQLHSSRSYHFNLDIWNGHHYENVMSHNYPKEENGLYNKEKHRFAKFKKKKNK